MNRTEFEALRDLPDKVIRQDIRFQESKKTTPVVVADDIIIDNSAGVDLRMTVHCNREIGSKTINVHVRGTGPICRLDVDGHNHSPAGRRHKHSLQTERCPDRNLPDRVVSRDELAGCSVRDVFAKFCAEADIRHDGALYPPDENLGGTP